MVTVLFSLYRYIELCILNALNLVVYVKELTTSMPVSSLGGGCSINTQEKVK